VLVSGINHEFSQESTRKQTFNVYGPNSCLVSLFRGYGSRSTVPTARSVRGEVLHALLGVTWAPRCNVARSDTGEVLDTKKFHHLNIQTVTPEC